MAKRPRFLRPTGRIGSSTEAIAIVCREQRLRDHEEFVRTHNTTVNVVVTEEELFVRKLHRAHIQSTLVLRACIFGEWHTMSNNSQEMIDKLNAAGILWELR